MKNRPVEIIKEYRVLVEGLEHPVYARIVKEAEDDEGVYLGELSHYCKQTENAATPYYPSLARHDIYSLEVLILNYLKAFTTISVVENKHY